MSDLSCKEVILGNSLYKILRNLHEIANLFTNNNSKDNTQSLRRLVEIWNPELIQLLQLYKTLKNNNSDDAQSTRTSIEALVKELCPVYDRELNNITAQNTMEAKASISVLQNMIKEAR